MAGTNSQADVSINDQLWIGRTVEGAVNWMQIKGVEEVAMPDKTPDSIDVTHQQSPGRSREEIPGLMTVAALSQSMQFWPQHESQVMIEELATLAETGAAESIQIAFVVGGLLRAYRGHVDGFFPSGTVGDKRMATMSAKVFERITPNPILPTQGEE